MNPCDDESERIAPNDGIGQALVLFWVSMLLLLLVGVPLQILSLHWGLLVTERSEQLRRVVRSQNERVVLADGPQEIKVPRRDILGKVVRRLMALPPPGDDSNGRKET